MRRLALPILVALVLPAIALAAPEGKYNLEGRFNGPNASGSVVGEGVCGYEEEWTAKKS